MNLFGFDTDKQYDYENGFYLTSEKFRLGKILAHFELYKMISGLPGVVIETGVFKGASLIRWLTFRDLLENTQSRKVIGFDTFSEFPETGFEQDKALRERFINGAGDRSISVEELSRVLDHKSIDNYELVSGNILETVPSYVEAHPETRIAMLHIDTDVYEPAKVALEHFYPLMVKGGIIVLDDYGTFPGETQAVDEFFKDKPHQLRKLPLSHQIPAYIVKEDG